MSGGTGDEVTLADSDDVTHERIVNAVRFLLEHTDISQRTLAQLFGIDPSSLNRALQIDSPRRREWKAREVFRLALFFDVPVEVFYGTNIAEVWAQRMADARRDVAEEHRNAEEGI